MQSVMSHNFSRVPRADIERSSFDRSHGYKTTLETGGVLYPIFVDEALPGDTFKLNMSAFARLATPIKPVMDNLFMDSFFFAVPVRLVWSNWQKFNGEQEDPGDSTDFSVPYIQAPPGVGVQVGELHDYMGVPTGVPGIQFSALWARAYNLIWNEWFRDQNLQNSIVINKGDGPDSYASGQSLLKRGKRHDYFTSCLPWPQKGPDVALPIGSVAPVITSSVEHTTGGGIAGLKFRLSGSGAVPSDGSVGLGTGEMNAGTASYSPSGVIYPSNLEVNLSEATSQTVNALREAFQLQRLFERDARGGTRYTEIIRSHFGVVSPDARLQRPEYLGGGSSPVNIHPVTQNSPTGTYANTPQGNLAAFGTASFRGHSFTKSFTEHCLIIGLVSVRADLTYQQGLNRMWSRKTRYDFYWPALSHLGEQAVLNKEIYAQDPTILGPGGTSANDEVFGYQERYAEYRYKPSLITGKFRSTYATSLDLWHLSQEFTALPALNSGFIEENPPLDRISAVENEPKFLFDAYFNLKCARPMPVFGVPGFIDHF